MRVQTTAEHEKVRVFGERVVVDVDRTGIVAPVHVRSKEEAVLDFKTAMPAVPVLAVTIAVLVSALVHVQVS